MAKLVYRASLLGIVYPEYDSNNAHRTWSNVKHAANHPPVEGVDKLTIDDLKVGGWRVKRVLDLEPSDIVQPQPKPEELGFFAKLFRFLLG